MSEPVFFWLLACPHGCSLRPESPSTTPLVPIADIRCPYHGLPMQNFKPVDVKS